MTGGDPAITIAPMSLAQVDAVVEIDHHSSGSPWAREVFIEELGREFAHVDVLLEGGRVAGFVNYWLVADEVHLLNVATHIEARRRGHGTRLVEHVIAFARAQKCRYVALEVRRSNEDAQRLYKRHGFRPVGVRPRYYANNQEDAIVMLLDFQAAPLR